jgi:hypothetical protein
MLRAWNFFEKNPVLWIPPSELDADFSSSSVSPEALKEHVVQGKSAVLPKL